jgi:hypothetical protein
VSLKRADSCSGYKASNVQRSDSSLTADLTLAGTACNIYGEDLKDLKFLAQWQTGMSRISTLHLQSVRIPRLTTVKAGARNDCTSAVHPVLE